MWIGSLLWTGQFWKRPLTFVGTVEPVLLLTLERCLLRQSVSHDLIYTVYRITLVIAYSQERKMLLYAGRQQFLQDRIANRERMNTGMTQSEVGKLISDITSATYVKYLYHKYIVKHGKMPGIKRVGRVVKALPTTTKRIQITVTHYLQWQTLVNDVWEKILETNLPPDSLRTIWSTSRLT